MIRRHSLLVCLFGPLLGWFALAGFAQGLEAAGLLSRAAAIYQRNCSVCHGEKGDGQSIARQALSKAPRDFTAEEARNELPREYMIAIVRDGKHDAPMTGRKSRLSQEDIEAVVDFIRTAFMPPEAGTALARGRIVYRRLCAPCHGDRGQGGTPSTGGRSTTPLSQSRTDAAATRDRIAAAIARDPHELGQEGFARRLESWEIGAVADYIRTAFIEAGARGGGDRRQRTLGAP